MRNSWVDAYSIQRHKLELKFHFSWEQNPQISWRAKDSYQSDPQIFECFSSYKTHADVDSILSSKMMCFLLSRFAEYSKLFLSPQTSFLYSLTLVGDIECIA